MGDATPLIVAIIVSIGGGAGIRELLVGIAKLRGGMSGKESKRKLDIIQQRDDALSKEAARADQVNRVQINRAREHEIAAVYRVHLINLGVRLSDLEAWPELESEDLFWPPEKPKKKE